MDEKAENGAAFTRMQDTELVWAVSSRADKERKYGSGSQV